MIGSVAVGVRQTTTGAPHRRRLASPRGWGGRLLRLLRYRLIVPLLRSRHEPEYTARGVALGVFWSLTPTVGFQTPMLLGVWGAAWAIGWRASLAQNLAWTWINNPVTMLPLYYLFYVTGQLLMGHGADLSGYGAFAAVWSSATDASRPVLERALTAARVLGWPTLIGCVPWAVAGALLGYRWSLGFLRHRAAVREARRATHAG